MSTPSLVSEIALLSERLADLLDREVAALRAGGPRALSQLQAEKAALVAAYEAQLAEARERRAMAAATPGERESVTAAAQRLDGATKRNVRAIQAARDVNARLMEAVVRAAAGQHVKSRGYGNAGGFARPAQVGRHEAVSIALDRRF